MLALPGSMHRLKSWARRRFAQWRLSPLPPSDSHRASPGSPGVLDSLSDRAYQYSEVARHETVLDRADAHLLQRLGRTASPRRVVDCAMVDRPAGPVKDRCDRVGRGRSGQPSGVAGSTDRSHLREEDARRGSPPLALPARRCDKALNPWIVPRSPGQLGAQRCKHVRSRDHLDKGRRSSGARDVLPAADRRSLRRHGRRDDEAEGHFADRPHPRQFP